MEDSLLKIIFLTATILTGILCGASLDQSIKQLPARHIIGAMLFSEYAKAADLKNGVIWYAILGLGAALFSIVAAIYTFIYHPCAAYSVALYMAGFFAICHSACTAMAAPTYHKQKKITDIASLETLFNRFEKIQAFRSGFIVLNFLSYVAALIILL